MTATSIEPEAVPLSELTLGIATSCLERLTGPECLTDETVVHDLRVATKRLRAAWQLVKPLVGTGLARERNRALREMSAHLSASRDQAVLIALAQALAARQTDDTITAALGQAGEALTEEVAPSAAGSPDPAATLDTIRATLADEIAAWHSLDDCDPATARRAIRHQLRKNLARARRDTRLARHDHDPELWHDWRKTVKRLRYQREFVAATQGRMPGKRDARISRLGTRLGERNDLANLAAAVDGLAASGRLDRRSHGLVRKAIAADEQRVMRNCRRLGRQVFLNSRS